MGVWFLPSRLLLGAEVRGRACRVSGLARLPSPLTLALRVQRQELIGWRCSWGQPGVGSPESLASFSHWVKVGLKVLERMVLVRSGGQEF